MEQRKIDIHCHTTNRPLHDTGESDATREAIRAHMRAHDITTTVLLATYFPHKGSGISNYRLHEWIREDPAFVMFGSLDMEHYFRQGMSELEELAAERKIHGIKIYTGYQRIDLHDEKTETVLRLAQEYALPVAFHAGYSHGSEKAIGKPSFTDFVRPGAIAGATAEYDVRTIICHLGKPFTKNLIQTMRYFTNTYADTSGLLNSKSESHLLSESITEIKQVLDAVGPKRVLFGTDFPVQSHAHSTAMLAEALQGYSREEQDLVYYENARNLLGLPR